MTLTPLEPRILRDSVGNSMIPIDHPKKKEIIVMLTLEGAKEFQKLPVKTPITPYVSRLCILPF
jgi:hypothetical protein